MASFIYITTNLINNKIYIGQSNGRTKNYLGSGTFIKKAIKKYGRKSFKREILLELSSREELNIWEKFYINLFNSRNSKIGYNMKEGGWNACFEHTQETKDKIHKRSVQPDNKQRIREIQKLACEARKGTHHNKISKLQSMESRYGRIREIEIRDLSGKIVHTCNFISEASEFTKLKISNIKNNLYGLSKRAGNFTFKQKEVCDR